MTTLRSGYWILVAIAIVGIALFALTTNAHDDGPTVDTDQFDEATNEEWTAWMEAHMTQYMGPGAVDWMESHMGLSTDQMARSMPSSARYGGC